MDRIQRFSDNRQTMSCPYCGARATTDDHIPPKVFLEDPLPANMHVERCCLKCNNSASADEEYCACIIECTVAGTTQPDSLRPKIRKILQRKPQLATKIALCCKTTHGNPIFSPEAERIKAVVLKLARGHASYELSEPQIGDPCSLSFFPLQTLNPNALHEFEFGPSTAGMAGWAELGSRAFQRQISGDYTPHSPWITVQDKMYRYMASTDIGVMVRGVIREYLGFEVIWDQ